MVSKVAVMAIVGILAIPIILGYAMNYESVQTTGYTEQGQSVDVSDMLASGIRYAYVAADPYSLNADNFYEGYYNGHPRSFYPTYDESASPTYSPLYLKNTVTPWATLSPTSLLFTDQLYYSLNVEYADSSDQDNGWPIFNIRDSTNNTVRNIAKVVRVEYDDVTKVVKYWYYNNSSSSTLGYGTFSNPRSFYFSGSGTVAATFYQTWLPKDLTATQAVTGNESIDIAKGFRVFAQYDIFSNWYAPSRANSVLFTIDLDDTAASDYIIRYQVEDHPNNYVTFRKINNEWSIKTVVETSPGVTEITYFDNIGYDSSRSNVYQVLFTLDHAEVHRVVTWPKVMGFANSYMNINIDWPDIPEYDSGGVQGGIEAINIDTDPEPDTWKLQAPALLMRFDYATVRGFTASVILNETYEPALLKSNPITKLTNIVQPGYSITFGGSTFNVSSDKTIKIGSSRPIPLEGMKFSSTPNEADPNQFDNKINGTTISTTNDPSSIVFNGQWAVDVRTDSMVEETVTEYKWVPGSFAWDGIDSNFLIVGLLGCLGVFIGLGIYCRQSNRSIWPVVIVCIGGMLIFIAMA